MNLPRTGEKIYSSAKSIVYRGIWQDRPVAIKQIPRPFCVFDSRGYSMESNAMEKLQGCSQVVRHLHTDYDPDNVWIVMDWVHGQNLKQLVQGRDQPLHEHEVRNIVLQVAAFINCCSQKGLIYADMKPDNVLMDPTGHIHVVDFGCTRSIHNVRRCYFGTPIYFPPEMFDRVLLPEHDIWGLGVLAYYLACGAHPFLTMDPREFSSLNFSTVEHGILHNPLTFRHHVWMDWSPEGTHFIQSLLQKDPMQRPTISRVLQMPWLA